MSTKTTEIVDAIPPADDLRRQLCNTLSEAEYIRDLLRIAERKERLTEKPRRHRETRK